MDQDYLKYKKYKKKYQELKKLLEGGSDLTSEIETIVDSDSFISKKDEIINEPDELINFKKKLEQDITSEVDSMTDTLSIKNEKKKTNGGLIGGLFLGGAAILAMILGLKK